MRKIEKGPEPKAWRKYRETPGVRVEFHSIPELVQALLREQGYICAYCTCRVTEASNRHRVEHLRSQHQYPDLRFDYKNLVICCNGGEINDPGSFHCDKSKGDASITFDLFSDAFIKTLSYSFGTGEIRSKNHEYDDQINSTLKLNIRLLCNNRKEALKGVLQALFEKYGKATWPKKVIEKQIEAWEGKDREGKYRPYSGIVLCFLRKQLQSKRKDVRME